MADTQTDERTDRQMGANHYGPDHHRVNINCILFITNMAKAVELLRSTNKSVLNNLAIFIYKSFQIRNEVMLNRD